MAKLCLRWVFSAGHSASPSPAESYQINGCLLPEMVDTSFLFFRR